MPRYISLIRFTEKGVKEIRTSSARGRTFAKAAQKAGVQVEGQYWTVGSYDGVLIFSADDETAALRCLTQLATYGNVRTETLRAFVDDEWDKLVGK